MSNATELLRRALFELAKYAPTEKSAENLFLDIKSYFDSEPEQSKWQGLSDDEIWEISKQNGDDYEYYRAIEQALKDKNS